MDHCQWCGVELSLKFGFGCCDECSGRLAEELAVDCPDCALIFSCEEECDTHRGIVHNELSFR